MSRAARPVACAPLLVASALLLGACRTALPTFAPMPAGDDRPARLLESWSDSARARQGLRGVARLAVDSDEGAVRIRGKQVLVAERPARLRVEVLGFLDQTLAVIVTDGRRYEVMRAQERRVESGEVHPGLLWREAHLALSPGEVIDVLLGIPLPDPALEPSAAFQSDRGDIQIDLADAAGRLRQRVTFDASGRLRSVETHAGGGRVWTAHYSDYELVGDTPFAHRIDLDVEPGATHAEISLRDVELNPALPPGLFALPGVAGRGG